MTARPVVSVDARLAEIEQREQVATPGPWEMFRYGNGGGRIHLSERTLIADMEGDPDQVATVYNEGDREFLFSAREDVPWLVSQLRDARAENERLIESLDRIAGVRDALCKERNDARHLAECTNEARKAATRERNKMGARAASAEATLAAVQAALAGDEQAVLKVAAAQQVLIDAAEPDVGYCVCDHTGPARDCGITAHRVAAEQDEPKRCGRSQFVAPPTVSNADANRFSHWNKPVSQPTEGSEQ